MRSLFLISRDIEQGKECQIDENGRETQRERERERTESFRLEVQRNCAVVEIVS